MKKVWLFTAILSLVVLMIFGIGIMSSTDCVGKHRFKINQIVYSRFSNDQYLIMDTLRDGKGRPSYEMLHEEDMVLDIELSYTRNKITNY
jgi:hypothetical protein